MPAASSRYSVGMSSPACARRVVLLSAGLALMLSAGLVTSRSILAQGTGAPVTLDFLALGADGTPVLDISAAQVSLKVDGKERKLASLRLVKSAGVASAPAAPSAEAAPAPFATNAVSDDGRSILFVVNEETLRPGVERPVREAITQLMATLSASDRVGLVTVPRGTINIDPSTAHAAVREALAKVTGRLTAVDSDQRPCRARDALDALRGMLAGLAGTPTTFVFFSAEMAGPTSGGGAGGNNACILQTNDFQRVGVAAGEARAQFYIVQPDTSATTNLEGLQNLAGVTGGQYQRLATDTNPLAKIAVETSARYVATFVPEPSERNGQSHRVELKVTREGVTVRGRSDVLIARGDGRAAAANPKEMVKSTTGYRDLQLRASAFSSRDASGKVKVVVLAEPVDPTTKFNAATVALIDGASNKLVVQASADEKMAAMAPLMISLLADPGTYRARVAVTDASGRAGAVDVPVTVGLPTAGPLKFSTMVLAVAGPQGRPALQFSGSDVVAVFVELYGSLAGAQLGAKLDVAKSLTGDAILTVPVAGRQTQEPDKFNLTAEIPAEKLPPGDYVVRATIGLAGQPEVVISRTLRKLP